MAPAPASPSLAVGRTVCPGQTDGSQLPSAQQAVEAPPRSVARHPLKRATTGPVRSANARGTRRRDVELELVFGVVGIRDPAFLPADLHRARRLDPQPDPPRTNLY